MYVHGHPLILNFHPFFFWASHLTINLFPLKIAEAGMLFSIEICGISNYMKIYRALSIGLHLKEGKQWRIKIHFWKSYSMVGFFIFKESRLTWMFRHGCLFCNAFKEVPKPESKFSSKLYFTRFHPIANIPFYCAQCTKGRIPTHSV